jgi:NADPH-dependent 2,4-dienoyl-CoA reductase/sulfur reductase-like enzyme/rhodanese-related sulfurtransferase
VSRTLIVGGVAAGMSAATRLRRLDEHAEIVVFEQGEHVSYANCGLPYYLSETIEKRESLLLQTPESLSARFRIDVRVRNRVTAINPSESSIQVLNTADGITTTEHFDYLVIATGASPRSLNIPGSEKALTLRDVSDADRAMQAVSTTPSSAVILGGGFIGVELAENLTHRGIRCTIVQRGTQLLGAFDPEMIEPMHQYLERNGVDLVLGNSAVEILQDSVKLSDSREIPADIVFAAAGVVPDVRLAREAGISIGSNGGIAVDEKQRTNFPNIFAVGDAVEKPSLFMHGNTLIPLANLANRHGRLVADAIFGLEVSARPNIGTAIVGAFGLASAITGMSHASAINAGFEVESIHLHPGSHAGYYPGAKRVSLKVTFEKTTGRILGAQATGEDGVDKRIDVLATAIQAGLSVNDLMDLELAYAPQFGSAKDAINQAGYVANNALEGQTKVIHAEELGNVKHPIIDVRTETENAAGSIPHATLIPVDQLRERIDEVRALATKTGKVIVHCAVGQRGHTAVQLLGGHGIEALNLSGGFVTWALWQSATARANS